MGVGLETFNNSNSSYPYVYDETGRHYYKKDGINKLDIKKKYIYNIFVNIPIDSFDAKNILNHYHHYPSYNDTLNLTTYQNLLRI